MTLTIYSPDRRLLEEKDILQMTLPGIEGQIQILPNHATMIGMLETGAMNYSQQGKETRWAVVSTGFFEVNEDQIQLMVETLEFQEEIDLERAQKAQLIAEENLSIQDPEQERFRKYELKLQRALARQQVAKRSS